jgi:hypothetical protein
MIVRVAIRIAEQLVVKVTRLRCLRAWCGFGEPGRSKCNLSLRPSRGAVECSWNLYDIRIAENAQTARKLVTALLALLIAWAGGSAAAETRRALVVGIDD